MKKAIALLIALCLCSNAFLIAADEGMGREDALTIDEALDGVYLVDRVRAIEAAGNLTDKAYLQEFNIVGRLLSRLRESSRQAEQIAILKALVRLSLNKMVKPDAVIDTIYKVIRNKDFDERVRTDALRLLTEYGNIDPKDNLSLEDTLRKMHRMVGDIAEESTHPELNPISVRMEAIRALGAMAPKGAKDTLTKILFNRRESAALHNAAAEGLYNYIKERHEDDPKLLGQLVRIAEDAEDNPDLRVASLSCIEQMLRNIKDFPRKNDLMEFLFARFNQGSEMEAVVASRCLLRLIDEDNVSAIVNAHIQKLQSTPSPVTAEVVFKGLVELLDPLAGIAGNDRSSPSEVRNATESARKIIELFAGVLAMKNATDSLRQTAIMGLTYIPMEFDRGPSTKALIRELIQATGADNQGRIVELEKALLSITRISRPFRLESNPEKPDVEAWKTWFGANEEYLKANDGPWKHYSD